MTDARTLLREYARSGSEAAFGEVVRRYVNLVYSTALRLVNGDAHLAQDVSQRVFADLAKMADSFSNEVMIGGWLHRHTVFVAQKTIRTERRRQAREEEAARMNDTTEEPKFEAIAPVLDEAINKLGSDERRAIVLRYFEEKDFQSVGAALGSSEEAARKRVNRALEKLRGLLGKRGVMMSAAGLAAALEAQAVTVAPLGVATSVTTAALATSAAGGGTALTTLYFMSMTKAHVGVIAAITVGLSIPIAMQYRGNQELRTQVASLEQQVQSLEGLRAENTKLSNAVVVARATAQKEEREKLELLRLRGEVGNLRKTANEAEAVVAAGKQSPLAGVTANPEMHKMLRDQQKVGLSAIYKGLGSKLNLPEEKMEALSGMLADNVMANIDLITAALRDGKSLQEMETMFARQEEVADAKARELLGDEGFKQYEDYNRKMLSAISAEQFANMMLKGEGKREQGKKLFELLEAERLRALAAAGLPEDFQLVPTLNFRNFVSEEVGERNLALLDSVYEAAQNQASAFLSPEEVAKFGEFRKMAINNNRLGLALNRKLMGPVTQR